MSPCWQVFGLVVYGREPLLASFWGNGCMIAFVSVAEVFSAVSRRGQVFEDIRVRAVRLPFREIAASRFALLAMTAAV